MIINYTVGGFWWWQGLVTPPDESIPSSPFSDHKSEESFWNRLNKRAKSLHKNTDSQVCFLGVCFRDWILYVFYLSEALDEDCMND
jgi:hypothetical protein